MLSGPIFAPLTDSSHLVDEDSKDGVTALHIAAEKGHTEVLKCLLKAPVCWTWARAVVDLDQLG